MLMASAPLPAIAEGKPDVPAIDTGPLIEPGALAAPSPAELPGSDSSGDCCVQCPAVSTVPVGQPTSSHEIPRIAARNTQTAHDFNIEEIPQLEALRMCRNRDQIRLFFNSRIAGLRETDL
jgi:hypothetical protein